MKKRNAYAHAALFLTTYTALLFDNFMYFYDKSVYCKSSPEDKKEIEKACD